MLSSHQNLSQLMFRFCFLLTIKGLLNMYANITEVEKKRFTDLNSSSGNKNLRRALLDQAQQIQLPVS